MTTGFHRARGGRVYVELRPIEADLVRTLVAQVIELVRDEAPTGSANDPLAELLEFHGPVKAPEDPVLARLLPDAYRDDDESAEEFRRYTERGLRDQKARNGAVVLHSLDAGTPDLDESASTGAAGAEGEDEDDEGEPIEVELDREQAQAWLRSLTDVRLALAARLGVEQDDDEKWAALPDSDPQAYLHNVYNWLGFLQETLVEAVWR